MCVSFFFNEKILNYSVFLKSSMIFVFQMLFSIQYIHSMLRVSLTGPLALIFIRIILFTVCLCHIGNVRRKNWILNVKGPFFFYQKEKMHFLTLIKVMLASSYKKVTKMTKSMKNVIRCLVELRWLVGFPIWQILIHKNKITINKKVQM